MSAKSRRPLLKLSDRRRKYKKYADHHLTTQSHSNTNIDSSVKVLRGYQTQDGRRLANNDKVGFAPPTFDLWDGKTAMKGMLPAGEMEYSHCLHTCTYMDRHDEKFQCESGCPARYSLASQLRYPLIPALVEWWREDLMTNHVSQSGLRTSQCVSKPIKANISANRDGCICWSNTSATSLTRILKPSTPSYFTTMSHIISS